MNVRLVVRTLAVCGAMALAVSLSWPGFGFNTRLADGEVWRWGR